tara:strand:+ start:11996 stop:12718 length:723 start_codon:yes stop_codon:yes gene_type:complete
MKRITKVTMYAIKKPLLFLLLGFMSFYSNAQESELLGTWYINNIIFGDIEFNPPPAVQPYITFYNSPNNYLDGHGGCNNYSATLDYDSSASFYQILLFDSLSEICSPEINGFENFFFDYFMVEGYNYQYEFFTFSNGQDGLIIYLDPFDQAVFSRSSLSISDNKNIDFTLYPNPVNDILQIKNNNAYQIISIRIYDLIGKLLMAKKGNVDQLDLSSLNNGVLLLEIETDQGVLTKKLIKE